MKRYLVLRDCVIDGVSYRAGDEIDLTTEQYERGNQVEPGVLMEMDAKTHMWES
jgi:hypothetical protein